MSGKGTEGAKHRSEMLVQLSVRRAAVPKPRAGGEGALGGWWARGLHGRSP